MKTNAKNRTAALAVVEAAVPSACGASGADATATSVTEATEPPETTIPAPPATTIPETSTTAPGRVRLESIFGEETVAGGTRRCQSGGRPR